MNKRRTFTAEFKAQVVLSVISLSVSTSIEFEANWQAQQPA